VPYDVSIAKIYTLKMEALIRTDSDVSMKVRRVI